MIFGPRILLESTLSLGGRVEGWCKPSIYYCSWFYCINELNGSGPENILPIIKLLVAEGRAD